LIHRIADATTIVPQGQCTVVRCPGHTIQFLNYGYTEYIRKTLELLDINVNNLEMKEYENWTPYLPTKRKD
jgi:hypothetical protein